MLTDQGYGCFAPLVLLCTSRAPSRVGTPGTTAPPSNAASGTGTPTTSAVPVVSVSLPAGGSQLTHPWARSRDDLLTAPQSSVQATRPDGRPHTRHCIPGSCVCNEYDEASPGPRQLSPDELMVRLCGLNMEVNRPEATGNAARMSALSMGSIQTAGSMYVGANSEEVEGPSDITTGLQPAPASKGGK